MSNDNWSDRKPKSISPNHFTTLNPSPPEEWENHLAEMKKKGATPPQLNQREPGEDG